MNQRAELVVATADVTGESPVWDGASGTLWWTDINGRRVHRLDAAGRHTTIATPGRVGCLAIRRAGGLVVAMDNGFSLFDPDTGVATFIAEPEAGMATHRFNDGRCDPQGRFLAGSMNLARDGSSAKLWRLDAAGEVEAVADDCTIANGLAFSPDGRIMYWVDGARQQVFQFDYAAEGLPANRRVWLDRDAARGRPDGGAVDADGCYWSARWAGGCVVRFTPAGKVDRIVEVPTGRVTMCAFGGPRLTTLYITTATEGMTPEERAAEPLAGGLFAAELDIAGLPEPSYAG